jgi:predicted TIM-barrel fold metal-dependent hydrolase
MDRFGVDVSVVSNLNGVFYKNTQSANEELHAEIKSVSGFQNRFIPFAVLNPTYAGWKEDLRVCVEKFGMKGIRLFPQYHDYELTAPACVELVKIARDRGLPVAFSLRMVDYRQRSWMDIEKEWALRDVVPIVKQVPDAKYLILNVANSTQLTGEEASVFRNANVLMDTSGRAVSNPAELLKRYGTDKLAFGTHAPILDYVTGLLRIESMREDEADDKVKDLVRSGNASRMLDL